MSGERDQMRHKGKIVIEYKYPDMPWVVYDWTQIMTWADALEQNVKQDYPNAIYRRRVEK